MKDYKGAELLYTPDGYIAWQCSTGENYEILFIEVREKRQGIGRKLILEMAKKIKPFHSVFVFRRAVNEEAGEFYRSIGFTETTIPGLYKDEDAVLGVIPYASLR